jgi:uncharacterized protein YsxB (DUF464 family)
VRILLAVSPDGLLRRLEAEGHAGGVSAGSNIACAAASMLLRTAGRLCAERGLVLEGGAGKPGEMRLVVSKASKADGGWLRGVTDFLMRGARDLQDEFPKEIVLRVEMTEV